MAAFPNWEVSLLRALKLPVNGRNVRWLSAWQRAEGGNAAFNPLNTTQSAPGAGSYNSVGVKSYRDAQQGLEATLRTLQNGRYRGILETLANPRASGFDFAHAIGASPWGTSGDLVAKVLGSPLPEPAQMQIHSKSVAPPTPDFRQVIMRQLGAQLFPGLPGLPMFRSPGGVYSGAGENPSTPPTARGRRSPLSSAAPGLLYPAAKVGKIIGTPYAGTHTLGNWESDNAIDISLPIGTPIIAPANGVIGSQIGSLGEGGRFAGLRVHLKTGGNEFYFAHLSRLNVKAGQRVKKGQIIGWSGEANGVAHLHLGLLHGNPLNLFGGR